MRCTQSICYEWSRQGELIAFTIRDLLYNLLWWRLKRSVGSWTGTRRNILIWYHCGLHVAWHIYLYLHTNFRQRYGENCYSIISMKALSHVTKNVSYVENFVKFLLFYFLKYFIVCILKNFFSFFRNFSSLVLNFLWLCCCDVCCIQNALTQDYFAFFVVFFSVSLV